MLIEAVEAPIHYKWPEGELRLEPGKPIKVPDDRGQKVLAKCRGKVRKVSPDWLAAWEELAQLTLGIEKTDERFQPVLDALEKCDLAFEQDDWPQFRKAATEVQRLVNEGQKRGRGK